MTWPPPSVMCVFCLPSRVTWSWHGATCRCYCHRPTDRRVYRWPAVGSSVEVNPDTPDDTPRATTLDPQAGTWRRIVCRLAIRDHFEPRVVYFYQPRKYSRQVPVARSEHGNGAWHGATCRCRCRCRGLSLVLRTQHILAALLEDHAKLSCRVYQLLTSSSERQR
jgi:hypothetical protein